MLIAALVILILLILILLIVPFIAGHYLARRFCIPKNYSLEQSVKWGLEGGYLTEDPRREFPWENFNLLTHDELQLKGHHHRGSAEKVMITIHGHRSNWLGMAKYFVPLIKEGWTVVTMDNRYFGESRGTICTGGIQEKKDTEKLIALVREWYPQAKIGLWGESMGAAIALQTLESTPPVDFVIAVCPFTELPQLFLHHIHKKKIRGILKKAAFYWADKQFYNYTGEPLTTISASKSIQNIKIPLLLVHGDQDSYVPTRMSIELYQKYPEKAELLLVPGGTHGRSFQQNPDIFWPGVKRFIASSMS